MISHIQYISLAALILVAGSTCVFGQNDPNYDALIQLQSQHDAQFKAARHDDAEKTALDMLRLAERDFADQPEIVASVLQKLAIFYRETSRYDKAEELYRRSNAIRERILGPDDPIVSDGLHSLALVVQLQGRFAEAESLYKQALAICEKVHGPDHESTAETVSNLATLYFDQGKYKQAEPLYMRVLAIKQRIYGPDHPQVAGRLNNIALLDVALGKFADAEQLYRRALAIYEKSVREPDPVVADTLDNLAALYSREGRYAEAEALYKRTLSIREGIYPAYHISIAKSLNGLANLAAYRGRFAEADTLHKRAIAIAEKLYGPDGYQVASYINNLAMSYQQQQRYADAAPLFDRALTIREKTLGPDSLEVAESLVAVANALTDRRFYADAEPLYARALKIQEKVLGPNHPDVAQNLSNFGTLYLDQNQLDKAGILFEKSVEIHEKRPETSGPWLALSLHNLAVLRLAQGKAAVAEPLVQRSLAIRERIAAAPLARATSYTLRARINWALGRKSEALSDLKKAMDLAEEQRGQASGAEHDRAALFGSLTKPFEQMVTWQYELKDESEAFAAMERSRARSLLDEMNLAGADLNAGKTDVERVQFNQQETELKRRIAELEAQSTVEPSDEQRQRLAAELAAARTALYDQYRDQRNNSPFYHDLIGNTSGPPRLSQLQHSLAASGSLVLMYLVGNDGTYLLAINSDGAQLHRLEIDQVQSQALDVSAGVLTALRLSEILIRDDGTGVVQRLSAESADQSVRSRLRQLWDVLVPSAERDAIIGGKYERLIVVPDGELSLLPFEALVVDVDEDPKYLLDVGPPVLSAPSTTVLLHLVERNSADAKAQQSVLTVGDPAYRAATSTSGTGGRNQTTGNILARLPFSGMESRWVAKNFEKPGFDVVELLAAQATERNLRVNSANRTVLHLACHGIVDRSFANFFGALALAPGAKGVRDSSDDGMLSLPEIYGLNLKSCELAILSACQTNYGPQQKGEGVWALSRGFLVAGSRRVVASNWLVDDEAAASLVSYFTAGIAQAEEQGKPVDYAQALQAAKRWVRQQEKWQHPYYWGTFVLVGPQ